MAVSELEGVTVEDVPKPKRHIAKKRKTKKRTKKILTEEFDIEENKITVLPELKKDKKEYINPEDDKFNSPEFHKKQHKL